MMRSINEIADSIRRGERISAEDAITLWHQAPLWLLGELATARKEEVSGKEVYYNRNVHLEPTNICLFNCEFCSFRRREGDADAWYMSLEEIEARAMELRNADITEVHIVGGVHPKHDLTTYCAMIRRVKNALPYVAVKAYTAVEIFYMIRNEGVSIVEGLRRLKEAGMECIPGGGAEIFVRRYALKSAMPRSGLRCTVQPTIWIFRQTAQCSTDISRASSNASTTSSVCESFRMKLQDSMPLFRSSITAAATVSRRLASALWRMI